MMRYIIIILRIMRWKIRINNNIEEIYIMENEMADKILEENNSEEKEFNIKFELNII